VRRVGDVTDSTGADSNRADAKSPDVGRSDADVSIFSDDTGLDGRPDCGRVGATLILNSDSAMPSWIVVLLCPIDADDAFEKRPDALGSSSCTDADVLSCF